MEKFYGSLHIECRSRITLARTLCFGRRRRPRSRSRVGLCNAVTSQVGRREKLVAFELINVDVRRRRRRRHCRAETGSKYSMVWPSFMQ